jgi:hypothetical protein
MALKDIIAKIQIKPLPDKKAKIEVDTPYWINKTADKTYINLALFGGITTVVQNEEDVDAAITEALTAFFHAANTYGKGIRNELKLLGWELKRNNIRFKSPRTAKRDRLVPTSFITPNSKIIQGMINTGSRASVSVNI